MRVATAAARQKAAQPLQHTECHAAAEEAPDGAVAVFHAPCALPAEVPYRGDGAVAVFHDPCAPAAEVPYRGPWRPSVRVGQQTRRRAGHRAGSRSGLLESPPPPMPMPPPPVVEHTWAPSSRLLDDTQRHLGNAHTAGPVGCQAAQSAPT
eukprot:scaffold1107_cov185-Pinguiococcus_pyrenoidosus.AAC.1